MFCGIYSPFSKATKEKLSLFNLNATCLAQANLLSISLSAIIGRRSIKMSSRKNCKPKKEACHIISKKSSTSMAARDMTNTRKRHLKQYLLDVTCVFFVKACVILIKGGMIMSVDFASHDVKHLATEMSISPKGNCNKGLLQTINKFSKLCLFRIVWESNN